MGPSGLVPGKLKEELKTLALSARRLGFAPAERSVPESSPHSTGFTRELAFSAPESRGRSATRPDFFHIPLT
jgi:hypothetical protein